MNLHVESLGIMGTGTNMFRSGIAHSSGMIFIGTYGPAPAIVWKFDPETKSLIKVGAPGEYQLDCMVEARNGKIYIGTAYNAIVYELDPETGEIRDLGSPPVDSTPWIFTMICTRDGEIYGAKGVGLFHLDWRTGKMQSCGIVPGEHTSPLISSGPIVRTLEERPDGILWGDTNRWIFTFDPKTKKITPVADVAAFDEACYAIIHGLGSTPVLDLYFQIYARFSGKKPKHQFFVCRAATGAIEPLNIKELEGAGWAWVTGWWMDGSTPRWLVSHYSEKTKSTIAVVDVDREEVIDRWIVEATERPPTKIAGSGLWFMSLMRGTLYQTDLPRKRLTPLATNPMPVECRCLAASPTGRLGTDTYDCGFVFTYDLKTGEFSDHGWVWIDDHRCNYGPAAFAGRQGRYFLANHGESPEVSALWVTDLQNNRHWRVGESTIQLVRFRDGNVWGVQGPNPPSIKFDPAQCWTPAWHARPGTLFRYRPGAKQVEVLPDVGPVGPIAEAPRHKGRLFFSAGEMLRLYDISAQKVIGEYHLPASAVAAATDFPRRVVYFVLANGMICVCGDNRNGDITVQEYSSDFGPVDRGCFALPKSGWLIGVASDGTANVFNPETRAVTKMQSTAPLPAGPAVNLNEDAWYFADRQVMKYSIT